MFATKFDTRSALTLVIAVCALGFLASTRERIVRPLQTMSNLLAALREDAKLNSWVAAVELTAIDNDAADAGAPGHRQEQRAKHHGRNQVQPVTVVSA